MDTPTINTSSASKDAERFNRPPRIQRPLPEHEITLPAPPVPTNPPRRSLLTSLLPGLGLFFAMALMGWWSFTQTGSWFMIVPMLAMAVVAVGSSVLMYREQGLAHQQTVKEQQEHFENIFELKKQELAESRLEEREIRTKNNPDIKGVDILIQENDLRLWERRPHDPDFSSVRIGSGKLQPSVVLKLPELDPRAPSYQDVYGFYQEEQLIADVPITINLRQLGSIGIWGKRQPVCQVLNAMLLHLITHHAPHELQIALLSDTTRKKDWDWLKWVQHAGPLQPDLPGLSVAVDKEDARVLLNDLANIVRPRISADEKPIIADPTKPIVHPVHYILIIDHYSLVREDATADYLLQHAKQAGVTIIDIESSAKDVPDTCYSRLEVLSSGELEFATTEPSPIHYRCMPDRITVQQASHLARTLTNKHQARSTTTVSNIPTTVRLIDALFAPDGGTRISVDDIDIYRSWQDRPAQNTWSILLGWKQNKEPVWLNLLEDRDGPHGLAAGTTGAGKSILLQSMILSLALTHSPSEINFVLIDFKGGSTAEAFRNLPHTVSVITNLQGRLVDRSLTILKAEARRRQEILNQVEPKAKDIATYHAYQESQELPPLPRLLIVIDEFAEMAKAMPTFMDEVNSIAAIGRSLGMHLILATQKPAGVVSDKVLANLKFRICLRVASAMDSRDMLGIADAALLPSRLPGRAYLKVGSERLELFQSANIAYPYRPVEAVIEEKPSIIVRPVDFDSKTDIVSPKEKKQRVAAGQTELEVLVARIAQAASPVPRWPDALPNNISLEDIRSQFSISPAWRQSEDKKLFFASKKPLAERLKIMVGIVDDPYRQDRRPLTLDLVNQHYFVVGAPRSGRSALCQTIVRAVIENTTPEEIEISLLDFGGQTLAVFQDAPHVANFLTVNHPAHLRRFLDQINEDLNQRSHWRASRQPSSKAHALYIIDGFAELKSLFPDEMGILARVARDGLSLDVHLIVISDQAMSVPLNIRNNLLGRLALQLSDSGEYMDLIGRVSGALPDPIPGRGLIREKATEPALEFQIALPIGASATAETVDYAVLSERDLGLRLSELSQKLDQAWAGQKPEPIRILDRLVDARDLPVTFQPDGKSIETASTFPRLVIGQDDRTLGWLEIDYSQHGPNFLVCGPPQSGKTNLLRLWVWNISERYSPEQVQFTLIGMKNKSLNALAKLPHVQHAVDTEFRLDNVLDNLEQMATERYARLKQLAEEDPDGDLDLLTQKLGPVHIVVIDDYDAVRFTNDRQYKLSAFARYGRDTRTLVVLGGTTTDLEAYSDLLNQLKRGRSFFMLQPGDLELRVLDARLPLSATRQEYPTGRGYLILTNRQELVQTAYLDSSYCQERIRKISSAFL